METTAPASLGNPVDDDTELTKLHPNYKKMLRLRAALTSIPFLIGALFVELFLVDDPSWPIPPYVVIAVVVVVALAFIIRVPSRRFAARGYQVSADRLRVVRGIWWRYDTVVPFGRVQHIDVDQSPLERYFGIATMTLHTAGSHNASVQLPGLELQLANDMREEIRAHIKRETM